MFVVTICSAGMHTDNIEAILVEEFKNWRHQTTTSLENDSGMKHNIK